MHTPRSLLLALTFLGASTLLACSSDPAEDPIDPTPAPTPDPAPFGLPQLADLPTDSFSFLKPGNGSICAGGAEYGFAIRRGDPNKIVVEFEGGGACWNNGTCNLGASTSGANAVYKDFVAASDYAGSQPGLRAQRDDNPVNGWTHVIVPYCSADVHWGDKTMEYPTVKIEHRGKRNAETVFDYVYSQLKAPKQVFVTGCSAGGYGSIYWTPALRGHYTDAKFSHLSDAAAGVIPPSFFEAAQTSWNLAGTFPTSVGKASDFTNLPYLYKGIGTTYPDVKLSQFNVENDSTQKAFLSLMGGGLDWRTEMLKSTAQLATDLPNNYRNYIGPGQKHCIIVDDSMYSSPVDGASLPQWIGSLIDGESLPDNVACPSCTAAK